MLDDDPVLQLREIPGTDQEFLPNLAKDLNKNDEGKETLNKIGNTVVDDYKNDLGSRSELDKRLKIWYRLFSGLVEPKNHPWDGCANINLPTVSIACHQSHSRSFDALLPPKEIAKCESKDGTAVNVAKRRQTYLNWQLTDGMPEWIRDQDRLLLILAIYGTGVKKSYYDPVLGRVSSRLLRKDEFVAPYGVKNLDDAQRKTHVIEMYVNDIKKKGKFGGWINTDDINVNGALGVDEKPAEAHTDMVDKATGISPSADTKDAPRIILEQHRLWDLDGDGIEEPYCVTVDKETAKVFSIQALTYENPITNKEEVFNYFTPYNFMPNPDSWMGLGYGHILEHISRSINSLTNQLTDAGTLQNTGGGFIQKQRNLKVGKLKYKMGQYTEVDLGTDDLRKAIYQFQHSQPSSVLYTLLQMLQDYAQKVSSVSDTMLGELPPSDTTATTMLTVMEQSMKVPSVIHRRIHADFKEELRKIETLNALYVDEDTYKSVQDSTAPEMEDYVSAEEDYKTPRVDVAPSSDPSITSRAEKLIKAQRSWELLKDDPDIMNDPEARYELKLNLLDAMEIQNIDKILKKPQKPPPPPDLRPEEEEAEFLAERGVVPLPQQDHDAHLRSHRTFKEVMAEQPKGEEAKNIAVIELSSQGKKLLDAHIRETQALLYLQQFQQQGEALNAEQIGAEQPELGGLQLPGAVGGPEGMGGEPLYPGVPADTGVGVEFT